MGNSRIRHIVIAGILGAYMVPGILSSTSLLGQALFFKLDPSFSVHNDRSIDIDERPYWTSHRHFTSSEQFSSGQFLNVAGPWISIITPLRYTEIPAAYIPTPIPLFPPNPLRAPPPFVA